MAKVKQSNIKLIKSLRKIGLNVSIEQLKRNRGQYQRIVKLYSKHMEEAEKNNQMRKTIATKIKSINKVAPPYQRLNISPEVIPEGQIQGVANILRGFNKGKQKKKKLLENKRIANKIVNLVFPDSPMARDSRKRPEWHLKNTSISRMLAEPNDARRARMGLYTMADIGYHNNAIMATLRMGNIPLYNILSEGGISATRKLRLSGMEIMSYYVNDFDEAMSDNNNTFSLHSKQYVSSRIPQVGKFMNKIPNPKKIAKQKLKELVIKSAENDAILEEALSILRVVAVL